MSKIHIKLMTEDALSYVKTNIKYVAEMVEKNDNNNWIYNSFPKPAFKEKSFEIDDFELIDNPDSKDKVVDFKNSVTIYEHLNSLPRYILSDERFWLWLHFEKFYTIVRKMMKINGVSAILNMWMHEQGVRRGLMFGVLSRCYYRVDLSIDKTKDDKFELTKWIICNPERFRNLTWRSFSSEKHLVRGAIKGEKKAIEEYPNLENNSFYPIVAKDVMNIGSVRLLDVISEQDMEEMVYNKMVKLINGEKD